jgi:hypothetical protein
MAMTIFVSRDPEEERGPVETVTRAELCNLFRLGLITQDGSRRIAWNEFD